LPELPQKEVGGITKHSKKKRKKLFLNRTSIDGGGQKLWRTLNHSINYK
jgi:hypothetical protein